MNQQDIDILLLQIRTMILNKPLTAELKSTSTELADLQEAISYLANCLTECNEFLRNLSIGNLQAKAPSRYNFLASDLKELQAGLLHMAWQANQVANGDYRQKVSFLGDFSKSFNRMVEQLEEREKKLQIMAFQDELTGLYNRRYGLQELERLILNGTEFSACLMDLDGLKSVNDNCGHLIGDEYITTVTTAMKQLDCDSDILCRVGGDEFVLILPHYSASAARDLMQQLDQTLAAIKRDYTLAVSYGIVYVAAHTDVSVEDVLKQIDDRMYSAKNKKKRLAQETRL